MINNLLLVGLGGAAGSILRYLFQRPLNTAGFPYGTLAVNITGCFVIGILWAFFTRNTVQDSSRLLLMTGFCGGFTTFSAFTLESIQMLTQGRTTAFIIYTSLSVIASLVATFVGYKLFN